MCRNLPSTATYRAATYLEPQLTVPEISVPQFAYCRNLPPAATYRLPEFSVPQLAVAATFRSPPNKGDAIMFSPCQGLHLIFCTEYILALFEIP